MFTSKQQSGSKQESRKVSEEIINSWGRQGLSGPTTRAVSHAPQLGVHAVTRGPNAVPPSLSPQRKLRSPKLKYEALEISEVRGPFERKVLMHYIYFGTLCKQDINTLQPLQLLLRALWKQGTLNITVAKRGPRQVSRLPSLKHTTVYKPDSELIWQWFPNCGTRTTSGTRRPSTNRLLSVFLPQKIYSQL